MKQYLRRPSEQFEVYEKQFDSLKKRSMLYTAFGNFDRIEFVPITKFSDYRSRNAVDKTWYGKRQSIILYALKKDRLFQTNGVDEDGKSFLMESSPDGGLQPLECQFFIHTMLHISGNAKSYVCDYRRFLELIQGKILELVDLYRKKKKNQDERLDCEVFGTFNSAEVAVLWAADQFTDVLFLLDELRHMRFVFEGDEKAGRGKEIFVSTYTVISGNPRVSAPLAKGSAMVQLECTSHGASFQETSEFIKKAVQAAVHASDGGLNGKKTAQQLFSCAGEYDYIAELPFSTLPYLFPYACAERVKDTFSIHNQEFTQYVRQTTTRLFYRTEDIDTDCRALNWDSVLCITVSREESTEAYDHTHLNAVDYTAPGCGFTYQLYQSIRAELEKQATYSGMWKTLELLYSDYMAILCTAVNHLWVKDFNEQFICALNIILSLLKWLEPNQTSHSRAHTDIFTSQFGSLCDILQQQINHISESSKLFYEVPNSKMGYTAQFDLVLHAYYGIVKELILNAYQTKRSSRQYALIPVINFANTPIIESKMLRTVDDNPESARLVSIAFPYDSWSNPLYYTPFLIHEVHHYVAPHNRSVRNAAFLTVILHRVCMQWVVRTAYCYLMNRDNRTISNMGERDRDEAYGSVAQRIAVTLEVPIYRAIYNERQDLLKCICGKVSPGVDNTAFEFRDILEFWLENDGLHEGRMKLISALIQKGLKNIETEITDVEILEYIEALSNGILYKLGDKHFYQECERVCLDLAHNSLEALREIYPDLAMVAGASMGLPEYLLQFATLQMNLLTQPSDMDDWDILALRLGPIMHLLLKKTSSLANSQRESFRIALREFKKLFPVFLRDSGLSSGRERADEIAQLAKSWSDFFGKVYGFYLHKLTIYSYVIESQIMKQYDLHAIQDSPINKLYEDYWRILRGWEEKDDVFEKVFNMNLKLIHLFQNQYSLKELTEFSKNQQVIPPVKITRVITAPSGKYAPILKSRPVHNTTFYLDNCDDLFERLRKMLEQLQKDHRDILGEACDPCGIWYRGISNSEYHILPSLFVNYHENAEFKNGSLSKTPYQLLLHNFQQFKFRSDGAPELSSQPSYQNSDYLALMQHYQIQTTLMDWSEDVFAALYFALEQYVQSGNPRKWGRNCDANAAVYLFDPAVYNDHVRRQIIQTNAKCIHKVQPCSNWCDRRACMNFREEISRTIDERLDLVPNVSMSLNRDAFAAMFFDKKIDMPFEPFYEAEELGNHSPVNSFPLCFSLPIAVYTSRLNPRIRAQSGQFLVYQPYTSPVLQDGTLKYGCFDYVALDVLQECWLKEHPEERPFLLKLIISQAIKAELGQQLRHMGIKTSNYYPELSKERFSLDK